MKRLKRILGLSGMTYFALSFLSNAWAAGRATSVSTSYPYLSAAIATGASALAAGFAVAYVGAAAMGAIGEKPQLMGRALIFVGLAEGIAIYGLIIAIMILGKIK